MEERAGERRPPFWRAETADKETNLLSPTLSSRGGKRGGRRDYPQHGLGVSSTLSSILNGGEGRGEEAPCWRSETTAEETNLLSPTLSSRGGKRGGRCGTPQPDFGVSSTLSSILNGGEGRGEEAVNLTSELLPPDMMMPEAFQPLAGG